MDIAPSQTRQEFVQMRHKGFWLHHKCYPLHDVDNHFAKNVSVELARIAVSIVSTRKWDSSWLRVLPQVICNANNDATTSKRRRILFISHRWLQSNHPDNHQQEKFNAILQAAQAYCGIHHSEPKDCYLWVDYCCIQQSNPNFKTLGIQALPFYIMLADAFIAIEHESYMKRAWCLLQMLLGSFMPTKTRGYDLYQFVFSNDSDERKQKHVLQEVAPTLSDLCLLRPQEGGVTDPKDMEYIRALT